MCGSPVVQAFRPFCSKRCADVDLGRWLNGSYSIAGRPEDEQDGLPTYDRERAPDSGDDGY
ncbi:MAG: DNA gyrase inhibitor YacG [Pseudomonadota bacterium]